ncbi:hypothetical protein GW891_04375, partial [bacterium]|nr:hypothetical protein [bacterium]
MFQTEKSGLNLYFLSHNIEFLNSFNVKVTSSDHSIRIFSEPVSLSIFLSQNCKVILSHEISFILKISSSLPETKYSNF